MPEESNHASPPNKIPFDSYFRENALAFADLHKLMPAFFRCGSNDLNIRELTTQQLELFEMHHGAVSVKLGYLQPLARSDI